MAGENKSPAEHQHRQHADHAGLPHPVALPEMVINLFWPAKYPKAPANRWLRQLMFEVFSD